MFLPERNYQHSSGKLGLVHRARICATQRPGVVSGEHRQDSQKGGITMMLKKPKLDNRESVRKWEHDMREMVAKIAIVIGLLPAAAVAFWSFMTIIPNFIWKLLH
jgi:hypothetical protein